MRRPAFLLRWLKQDWPFSRGRVFACPSSLLLTRVKGSEPLHLRQTQNLFHDMKCPQAERNPWVGDHQTWDLRFDGVPVKGHLNGFKGSHPPHTILRALKVKKNAQKGHCYFPNVHLRLGQAPLGCAGGCWQDQIPAAGVEDDLPHPKKPNTHPKKGLASFGAPSKPTGVEEVPSKNTQTHTHTNWNVWPIFSIPNSLTYA